MALNNCTKRLGETKTLLTKIHLVIEVLEQKKDELTTEEERLTQYYNSLASTKIDDDKLDNEKCSWTERVHDILRKTFKFNSFRPKQLSTINSLLKQKDVILIMPTAGGKTLTYLIPAILNKGLTLVVSPTIAFIEDQLIRLNKLGIEAATIHANIQRSSRKNIHNSMITIDSPLKILFVTAEWIFRSKTFMNFIQTSYQKKVLVRLVIEEIHCCSLRSHEFRTDYQKLEFFKRLYPDIQVLGLTATASSDMVVDIKKQFHLTNAEVFKTHLNRENLFYKVMFKPERQKCIDIIANWMKNKYSGMSGIIFVTTAEESNDLSAALIEHGLSVRPYNYNLDVDQKSTAHREWLDNSCQALVATGAFGLGIDKPDVRFVIHYSMPKSLERYYQECGRAGRNGVYAECILMFGLPDYLKHFMSINESMQFHLDRVLAYCIEQRNCRRSILMANLKESFIPSDCNRMCDLCIHSTLISYDLNVVFNKIMDITQNLSASGNKLMLLKLLKSFEEIFDRKCPQEYQEYIIGFLMHKEYLIVDREMSRSTKMIYIQCNLNKERSDHILMHHRDNFEFPGIIVENPQDDDTESTGSGSQATELSEDSGDSDSTFDKTFLLWIDRAYELIKARNKADADRANEADIDTDSDKTTVVELPKRIPNWPNYKETESLSVSQEDKTKSDVEKGHIGANADSDKGEVLHLPKKIPNWTHFKEPARASVSGENRMKDENGKEFIRTKADNENIYTGVSKTPVSSLPTEIGTLPLSRENKRAVNNYYETDGTKNLKVRKLDDTQADTKTDPVPDSTDVIFISSSPES